MTVGYIRHGKGGPRRGERDRKKEEKQKEKIT